MISKYDILKGIVCMSPKHHGQFSVIDDENGICTLSGGMVVRRIAVENPALDPDNADPGRDILIMDRLGSPYSYGYTEFSCLSEENQEHIYNNFGITFDNEDAKEEKPKDILKPSSLPLYKSIRSSDKVCEVDWMDECRGATGIYGESLVAECCSGLFNESNEWRVDIYLGEYFKETEREKLEFHNMVDDAHTNFERELNDAIKHPEKFGAMYAYMLQYDCTPVGYALVFDTSNEPKVEEPANTGVQTTEAAQQSPFELEADQKKAFEAFMEAAQKLNDAGVHLVGWSGGEFDVVNERKLEWDVLCVSDKSKEFDLLYPHQRNEINDLKNIKIPGITAGYFSDGYGIRCKLKK